MTRLSLCIEYVLKGSLTKRKWKLGVSQLAPAAMTFSFADMPAIFSNFQYLFLVQIYLRLIYQNRIECKIGADGGK